MAIVFLIEEPTLEETAKNYYFSDSRATARALVNGKGWSYSNEEIFGRLLFFSEDELPLDLTAWASTVYPRWQEVLQEAGLESSTWENWKSTARKAQKLKRLFVFHETAQLEKKLREL